MDTVAYLRFVAALVLVLGLLLGVLWALRKFGFGGMVPRAGARRRLGVVEVVSVDAKRRLVLVRRDDREHLLLVGGASELVIERDIRAAPETGAPGVGPVAAPGEETGP